MKVSVHYYAGAKDLAGCEQDTFELEPSSVPQAELRRAVSERHPQIASFLSRMRLAINGDFVGEDRSICDGDRVDVLPPVAGGAGNVVLCRLGPEEISIDEVRRAVTEPAMGGICLFLGVVRNHAEGAEVARLDYEAHESLAIDEMRRVLDRVGSEHPEVRLAAVHRIGRLAIGDVAVCVAAGAPHRAQAFEACRSAIDRIKETVPIWKKEWGPEGEAHWVNLEG